MIEKKFNTPSGIITYWINKKSLDNKETIIFLPGLTADHRLFEKQIDYFNGKYNLLIWDPPGHGISKPFNLTFSLYDQAHWLHNILEKEDLTKPVIVGQSMGGYIGQVYNKEFPHTLTGFISLDSGPLDKKFISKTELKLLKNMEPVYNNIPWKWLLKLGSKNCSETKYGRQLMKDMMEDYTNNQNYYSQLVGHGFKILANTLESEINFDLNCPALLICGKKDKAGSTKRLNKAWAKETGLPLKWIKNAGHNSNSDQPEVVNLLIEVFLLKSRLGKIEH